MDSVRRLKANDVYNEIRALEKAVAREKEKLEHFMGTSKYTELVEQNEERKLKIEILKKKEQDIREGKYDDELFVEKPKQKPKEEKKELKETEKRFEEDTKYKDNMVQKDMKYYYKQYEKANETLPDYIKRNLLEMPNNRGYVWRGCWFFGKKKDEIGKPLVIIENMKGLSLVHEYTATEHAVYEKKGNGKTATKKLISCEGKKIVKKFI